MCVEEEMTSEVYSLKNKSSSPWEKGEWSYGSNGALGIRLFSQKTAHHGERRERKRRG